MQSKKRVWKIAIVMSLLCAFLAQAAEYKGKFISPNVSMDLNKADDGYAGTLTIKGNKYPAVAKEKNGALEGTFAVADEKFPFTAKLDGNKMLLTSSGKTFELSREKPANPMDDIAAPNNPPTNPPANPPVNPAPDPANGTGNVGAGGGAGATLPEGPAAVPILQNIGPVHTDPNREWLIMVYMNADNNLLPNGPINIKQMELGLPETGVDVLVLFDRPIKTTKDGTVMRPRLYHVTRAKTADRLDSEIVKEFGMLDMADPNMISAFVEGAIKAYPARQYALFPWNHGGGWRDLNNDDNAGKEKVHKGDSINVFHDAVQAGLKAGGIKKLDLISFDMCLMGQLEVAAEMRDIADVMVASQDLEPGLGQPYTAIIETFGKGTKGPRGIATNLVQEYDKFHKNDAVRSTTMAAYDLSVFDEVNTKLNAVCDKLIPEMSKDWVPLAKSYLYAEQYNASRDEFHHGKMARQSIDLLDALKKCQAATPNFPARAEFKELRQSMDKFVIASANSERRKMSNGVAIYAPLIESAYNPDYEKLQFYKSSKWPKLLKALYPEQAKHNEAPSFGKIEIVGSDDKPIPEVLPIRGHKLSIEVEGKGIVWVRDMPGVRDAAAGGLRILSQSYVVDADFAKKFAKVDVQAPSQDVDLIMPQFNDGKTKINQPLLGMIGMAYNGDKTYQVMVDNSDLMDPTRFSVLAEINDPKGANRPVRVKLIGNAVDFEITEIEVLERLPNGELNRSLLPQSPSPETKVTPIFFVFKDDGTMVEYKKETFNWNNGISFGLDYLPAGDYEDVLVAETIAGASKSVRFAYKVGADDRLIKSKDSFRGFKFETMVGTWDWIIPSNPPKKTGISMVVSATKKPNVFQTTFNMVQANGSTKSIPSILILATYDQPFFRLILVEKGQKPVAMFGPMIWAPENGTPVVRTVNLSFLSDIYWLKQANGPVQPGPVLPGPVQPGPKPNADGSVTVTDANQTISINIPQGFTLDEEKTKLGKTAFTGYEALYIDGNTGAAVQVIRFDGINDPNKAIQEYIKGCNALGIQLQVFNSSTFQFAGVQASSFQGQMAAQNAVMNVGLNFIPTAKGYVAINFGCSPFNVNACVPMFMQILQNAKLLQPPAGRTNNGNGRRSETFTPDGRKKGNPSSGVPERDLQSKQ